MGLRDRKWAISATALIALAVALVAVRVAGIYRESVNWDELAFFERAAKSLRSGTLEGGARPGLAVLPALPLVDDCTDEIGVVRAGRWIWLGVTIASLVGLFCLLRALLRDVRQRVWLDAALGVALIALVPLWIRWSLQVRTDQWAIACGVWGSVALLGSRRRLAYAAVTGVLWGAGWLFTQKVIYVAALGGLLALGDHLLRNEWVWRRELLRAGLLSLSVAAALVAFHLVAAQDPVVSDALEGQMSTFDYYRRLVGFRVYRAMLPTLAPHLLLGAALLAATVGAALGRVERKRELALAWAVLALGTAVAAFHASAFSYFWMTLGLFPAVAGAIALGPVRELLPTDTARRLLQGGVWSILIVTAVPPAASLLEDTQAIQREAFAFVDRNFPPEAQGFHPEQGMFCRKNPQLFVTFFAPQIDSRFFGRKSKEYRPRFLATFREEPVQFIISSYRMGNFPRDVIQFWNEHYVRYGPAVLIPGFLVRGPAGTTRTVEVLVAGDYRWWSPEHTFVSVDGRRLSTGETVHLTAGSHTVQTLVHVAGGMLAYDVADPPSTNRASFYSRRQIREIAYRR